MTRVQVAVALGLGLALGLAPAATAEAAAPQVNGVTPLGVRRGEETKVVLKGANLKDNPRLVAPFAFHAGGPGPADAGSATLVLTADPGTPVGVYPVRVQTDDGLSNPFLLAVGQLPQVAEVEDNGTFESAQVLPTPVVVEGQAAGNDVDFFRFTGKKGQKVVVDAQCARVGSGVDPTLRLTTAARAFIASAEDSPGLLTDARMVVTLPADGDYVIELSDSRYQGGNRPVYRLVVGEVPVADEVFPLGGRGGEPVDLEIRGGTLDGPTTATVPMRPVPGAPLVWFRVAGPRGGLDVEGIPALVVGDVPELREPADPSAGPVKGSVPVAFNGRIDPAGDEDRFELAVTPGQRLRIVVEAADRGSSLDGVLRVLNPKGDQLAQADDTAPPNPQPANKKNVAPASPDPTLDLGVPTGVTAVTLALRDLGGRGGVGFPYRVLVTPGGPTFELAPSDAQVSVPKGGTVAVGVSVTRKGYDGPVALRVENPPAGLTVRPGSVAKGQAAGALTVTAAADADFGVIYLDVVGEGQGPGGPITVRGRKALVFAQQGPMPANEVTQVGLPAAPARAEPLALDTPAAPVEVAHGLGATVPVTASRGKDAGGALALTVLNPPPGLTAAPGTLPEKAGEGSVAVTTTTDLPLGRLALVVTGKGKVAGAERTFVAPAVTLDVVRPASVELDAPAAEVKAGASFEVKGKVVRKGAFREPVTVKVNGLPAGLKAEPAVVPGDAEAFTVQIVADAKAATATVTSAVALAFQVNKKDYPESTVPLSVKVLPAE